MVISAECLSAHTVPNRRSQESQREWELQILESIEGIGSGRRALPRMIQNEGMGEGMNLCINSRLWRKEPMGYLIPVEPKPPLPRFEAGRDRTSMTFSLEILMRNSWAILSPLAIRNGNELRFFNSTKTSPR
jgi:hypothetical protein